MNTTNELPNPLQLRLTAESADQPLRAAIEARRRNGKRHRNCRRFTMASMFLLLAAFTWLALPWRDTSRRTVSGSHSISESQPSHATLKPAHPPDAAQSAGTSNGTTGDPDTHANRSLPTGLNPDQLELVKAAGDLPMLLERNSSGKVTRIHVIALVHF